MSKISKHKSHSTRLKIAVPSDGAMYEPTKTFLAAAGIPLIRPSPRSYVASLANIDGVEVILQRARDITFQVEEGNVDLGFVGYDDFQERRIEGGNTVLALSNLGFGRCELVVAVPSSWVDVDSMADIADLSVEFRESGREFRVATKFTRLAQRFLFQHGVSFFNLPQISGSLEAAPAMNYSDFIIDITATGTSIRENHLKTIADGTVINSEGCLIANANSLRSREPALEATRELLSRITNAFDNLGSVNGTNIYDQLSVKLSI
ncbi:MAG: ATP phosphoribosyltransferase [Dehalococcoidia bacterium]|nr:ATP phosphoribosyltransferase [Dehalococcoidia bacterium]|tara:strand:- start:1221 stop:2012 length:792 start_codon:yes stop_codon:yes gene_type:complete